MSDPYKILEIERNATPEEITKAFRRLARKYHPDKNKDPDAEEKFKEINNAYKKLTSKSDDDINDIFADLFGSMFGPGMQFMPFSKPKMKVETPLSISLEELYKGGIYKIEYSYKCQTGKVVQITKQINMMGMNMVQIINEPETVDKTGVYELVLEPKFDIDKKYIVIDNVVKDNNDKEGYGDLYIMIIEKKHNDYKRVGGNLHLTLNVSLKEALIGTSRNIKTLDGQNICLNFITVLNYYEPKIIKGSGYNGDLYINFNIDFPKELTKENKNKLKDIL